MAQKREFYVSEQAYLALEEASPDIRYEYSDGEVRMLAGQTMNHAIIAKNIGRALEEPLRGKPCREVGEMRFQASAGKYYYPDRSVTCDQRDLKGKIVAIKYPCLVFEILSPSTEMTDRGEKAQVYQQHPSIQEYVFLDADYPHVEVYSREGTQQWVMRLYTEENIVELRSINARIPIEEFYRDTFPTEEEEAE